MLLQNRYQRQRLYTRITLGKAKRMDVVWGETAGVDGQLWLLCPILFTLQGFEAYVGVLLLQTAVVGVVSEWQVVTCGILLIVMATGNFVNTVQTLLVKSRFKAKMKKGHFFKICWISEFPLSHMAYTAPATPEPARTEQYVQELMEKIKNDPEDELEAKVNRKVQENMARMMKKVGEANPDLILDIADFCPTASSDQDNNGTPLTQGGATSN